MCRVMQGIGPKKEIFACMPQNMQAVEVSFTE